MEPVRRDQEHMFQQDHEAQAKTEKKLIELLTAAESAGYGSLVKQLGTLARKSMNQSVAIRQLTAAHLRTKRRLARSQDDKQSLAALLPEQVLTTWKLMRAQQDTMSQTKR